MLTQNGLLTGKNIPYSNFYTLIMICVRLKHVSLFDVSEYSENLKKEQKSNETLIKPNTYDNCFTKKMLEPEYGINYIKCLNNAMVIYLFIELTWSVFNKLINHLFYLNSFTAAGL